MNNRRYVPVPRDDRRPSLTPRITPRPVTVKERLTHYLPEVLGPKFWSLIGVSIAFIIGGLIVTILFSSSLTEDKLCLPVDARGEFCVATSKSCGGSDLSTISQAMLDGEQRYAQTLQSQCDQATAKGFELKAVECPNLLDGTVDVSSLPDVDHLVDMLDSQTAGFLSETVSVVDATLSTLLDDVVVPWPATARVLITLRNLDKTLPVAEQTLAVDDVFEPLLQPQHDIYNSVACLNVPTQEVTVDDICKTCSSDADCYTERMCFDTCLLCYDRESCEEFVLKDKQLFSMWVAPEGNDDCTAPS